MKIVIGIPTGQRHKQAVEVVKAWERACIYPVVITWDHKTEMAMQQCPEVHKLLWKSERRSFAWNHNCIARDSLLAGVDWDAYIAGADDLWPGNFDIELLIKYIKAYPDKILYVHDGALSQCATHPVVTRGWFESHNRTIYDEAYGHGFCDVDLTVTAAKESSIVKCFDIRFDHRHPIVNKSVEVDEIYKIGRKLTAEGKAYFDKKFVGVDVKEVVKNIPKGKLI